MMCMAFEGQEVGRILTGTASWTDKSLVDSGHFYPPEADTPAARLRHYAGLFPLVEVDSSYYGLPTVHNSLLWVERTPPGFVFDAKAFRLFTQHPTEAAALPKDIRQALGPVDKTHLYYRDVPAELRDELWQRFDMGIAPLRQAGRLGVVLFQFPPWFLPSGTSYAHITSCQEKLPGCRLAVEFRNRAWFSGDRPGRVWEYFRERGIAHVVVDEPQGFASSTPALWEASCPDVAVVRLHGRNRDTWELKGLGSSGERFKYHYGPVELQELAQQVRALASRVEAVHVLFNNNYEDWAQRNALEFQALLAEQG